MKTRLLLPLVLASALSLPALAAPKSYSIDNKHSFPRFSHVHLGLSTQVSRFDKISGEVIYDAEKNTGKVDISIDMSSVSTGSDLFNEHLMAEDFFHTEKYPTARFKSTRTHWQGPTLEAIDGELTIKGVTRPVTLTVTRFVTKDHPMAKKPAIGADAYVVVKRSDFNMGKYAPAVSDEVRIDIAFEALQK